jgi:hypothetical protein
MADILLRYLRGKLACEIFNVKRFSIDLLLAINFEQKISSQSAAKEHLFFYQMFYRTYKIFMQL